MKTAEKRMKALTIKTKLDQEIYPVAAAASLLGITDGRVYQLIVVGRGKTPENGQHLLTATHEELLRAGVNPSIIKKPRHWITAAEIERFRRLKRRYTGTESHIFGKLQRHSAAEADKLTRGIMASRREVCLSPYNLQRQLQNDKKAFYPTLTHKSTKEYSISTSGISTLRL